jgi:eukaryotic-like serine/threonine-protein kinase
MYNRGVRCRSCYRRVTERGCPRHTVDEARRPRAPERASLEVVEIEGLRELRLVGSGGMARVFSALDGSDTAVAVKVSRQRVDARLDREAAALQRVGPPTAPRYHSAGRTRADEPYVAMELLRGLTLADFMASLPARWADLDTVSKLGRALAAAVDHMHGAGLVHRDLKPENLFLRTPDDARLGLAIIDYGLAGPIGDTSWSNDTVGLTRTGEVIGTVVYMAPEQCEHLRGTGAAADRYSLGVVLYELIVGRPPFLGDQAAVRRAHIQKRPPRPSEIAGFDESVDVALLRALAKDPAQRFETAAAMWDAVEQALLARKRAPAPSALGTTDVTRAAAERRPVALLGFHGPAPASQLAALLSPDGGLVVRVHGTRQIVAFPHQASREQSIRAAQRAAGRLQSLVAGRLVIHVAEVQVRQGARGPVFAGSALEKLDPWWPADESVSEDERTLHFKRGGRVLLTADARMLVEESEPAPSVTGSTTLRGRDDLVIQLEATLGESTAILGLLTGEPGVGKSRVLAAVGDRLNVALLRGPDALRALLGHVLGHATPTLAQVRAAVGPAWPAVALSLDLIAPTDAEVTRVVAVPGLVRQTVAHVIGSRLRGVVLVDDAHRADPAVLDALELATMGSSGAQVLITATPSFATLRPSWGDRAATRFDQTLGPLAREAADAMLLDVLGVEFLPRPVADRLLDQTQCVPGALVELAHVLAAVGAIKKQRGGEGWYVAADGLLNLAGVLTSQLAERAIEQLSPGLRAFAGLCAVIGGVVTAGEIDAVLGAGHELLAGPLAACADDDPGVMLARLCRAGILEGSPAGAQFRQVAVREAIEARLPIETRRALHHAVYLHLALVGNPARVAHHAAAAGLREEAFTTACQVADRARARHQYVEADQHYTIALAQLDDQDPRRCHTLAGRGVVRHRVQRLADALADLRAARELAERADDQVTVAETLLEEAAILDWQYDFAPAEERGVEALAVAMQLGRRELITRGKMAVGRAFMRRGELDAAIARLTQAAEEASVLGDHETHVIALLCLGASLSWAKRFAEAQACLGEVITACEAVGDSLHLAAAYGNRQTVWIGLGQVDRAVDDLQRGIALARQVGNPQMEHTSTHNVAELLLWRGSLDEALRLARRARQLSLRFINDPPIPYDALLLARLHSARGERAEAAEAIAWLRAMCPENLTALQRKMVDACQWSVDQTALPFDAARWELVIEDVAQVAVEYETLEVLFLACHAAHGAPPTARWVERALTGAPDWWRERFVQFMDSKV